MLTGRYNISLVIVSLLMAMLASYTALDMAARVAAAKGRAAFWWLAGGSIAMGVGIWSMRYLGMRAFLLPVPVEYDWPTVLFSMIAACSSSAVALFVVSRKTMSRKAALGVSWKPTTSCYATLPVSATSPG